jgi:hypothetical protein
MKKTLIIATAAGLAMSSGVEETQDNELFMNSIKNGYYTVSNAILSRPAMIAGGMQMVQNGMARPTFLNHFDEAADDEFMAKGHGEHGHKQKDKKKDGKKKPRPQPQPVQEAQPVEQVQDNNLAFEDDNLALEDYQDDELVMGAIKNGYYTATNWVLANPAKVYGIGNVVANGLMNPKWDDEELMAKGHGAHGEHGKKQKGDKKKDGKKPRPQPAQEAQPVEQVQDNNLAFEDDNLALEDYQDDELIMNAIKNGYYTVSNAILSRPAMIAGGMQMVQNGMARPTFLNHFDEAVDDELAAAHGKTEKTEKTEKPKKRRQPLERPDDVIKRNTKLRVPKDIAADNTLFDLAELLEDN